MSERPDFEVHEPLPPEPGDPGDAGAAVPRPPVVEERMHPLSPLVSLWLGVVALAWFAITSLLQGDPMWNDLDNVWDFLATVPWWLLIVVGFVAIGLGFGYWGWWTTRFVIDDHEFRLENTGAFQESQRIAFSRIQSVDVTQPIAARLLGLAQVRIDVGADDGATLSYLRRARAVEIRDYLMARAHGVRATTQQTARSTSAWDDSATGDQVLVRLSPGEIILSAFANLDILMLVLALSIPLILGQVFNWSVLSWGGGMVGLALALFGYLSSRLFGQFNYTLALTPAGLRITRGLFTLRSQTIPTHRVQAVATRQPLIWRWLGRARLDVTILGSGSGDDSELGSSMIYLPFGTPAQVQVALAALWPGLELERLQFARTPERARWLSPLQWKWLGFALDDRVLAVRSGWTHRRQVIVPHARVQSVSLNQGPLGRRLRLATVQAMTTDLLGTVNVAHLDSGLARRLAFDQMYRARASRVDELLDPPNLRAASGVGGSSSAATFGMEPLVPAQDVWTPPTAPLPGAVPEALQTSPAAAVDH